MESNIDNSETEYDGCIDDFNTMSIGQRHQMLIDAIAKGNKQQFADLVVYPVRRISPVPDIETKEQMISYFDTLFDKSFRERIAHLDSNSWEEMGWRGWMLLNGEIWDTDPGIVINYSSPLEQQYAQELEKKIWHACTRHCAGTGNHTTAIFLTAPNFRFWIIRSPP